MLKRFLLCILFIASSAAIAQPKSTEDWSRRDAFVNLEKLDESIVAEWEGGAWKHEGVTGSFRFFLTEYKKGREKLYIQWVLDGGEAAYSMSVKELNIRPEYDLTLPECLDGDSCRLLKVNARHFYEETDREFQIKLDGLGSYSFDF
ncbi:MAG: hypothetical protein K6L80_02350 [Agarilytica sp.]